VAEGKRRRGRWETGEVELEKVGERNRGVGEEEKTEDECEKEGSK
jgi:hypothetical protein